MVMGWIWTAIVLASIIASAIDGRGAALAAATVQGAKNGVDLAISMAGAIVLWSGVGTMMQAAGITNILSAILRPVLHRLFPDTKHDRVLEGHLSANICANILGLGNAATPMGIQAAKRMVDANRPGVATDQLCRLIVLNTASIQLIPSNVAAVRVSMGCKTPFDILIPVWVTSLCAAVVGLLAAWTMGKLWHRD